MKKIDLSQTGVKVNALWQGFLDRLTMSLIIFKNKNTLPQLNNEHLISILRKLWKSCVITVVMVLMIYCGGKIPTAIASPTTKIIKISLGNSDGELKFFPEHLEFTAGQSYKLLLHNPSSVKHYFTAKDFADASWTKKVQAGKVEVKGAIHELELKPGGEAEWVLTPMKSGTYELYCSIAGHKQSGMVGEIIVK